MARSKYKCGGRGKQQGRKSGVCTMCGRPHPRGKNQQEKARAHGWESCASVAMRIKMSKEKKAGQQ